jgi:hypothetical protein
MRRYRFELMTGRQRKPATSAIRVAKMALTSAIIGLGGLALAASASAATHGECDQDGPTWALHVPLAPAPQDPAVPPVPPPVTPGPPPVPPVPTDSTNQSPGQFGYFQDLWDQYHNLDPNDITMGGDEPDSTDPAANPPPGRALDSQPPGPQPPP